MDLRDLLVAYFFISTRQEKTERGSRDSTLVGK